MADKKPHLLPAQFYKRCWPYHAAMKFFYHVTSQILEEKATYFFSYLYDSWLDHELRGQSYDVIQAIMGFGIRGFYHASSKNALKVVDCPNTHPVTYSMAFGSANATYGAQGKRFLFQLDFSAG